MQRQSTFGIPGNVARAYDVVRVLVKYGLAEWLKDTKWEPARRALTSHTGEILTDQPLPVRIRLALTDVGTTFVKLGQVLATRPDLVGPAIASELSHLQTETPADPAEIAIATVEKELGRPIAGCFAEFEPSAIASASIGQVHRAKLPNGRSVVVKVQHPGIEDTIRRDLDILSRLATLAEQHEELKRYQPVAVAREFQQTLMRELDFRREMRNLQRFRQNFAADHMVTFPKPYPELCTGRVLTMQMLRGTSVGDVARLHRRNVDCEAFARRGAEVFVQMIFRDGFYHADPHPGNILVMAKGRVGILDVGMVGQIDEELREQIVEIMLAAVDRDVPRLVEIVADICSAPADLDRGKLCADIEDAFDQYGTQAVSRFDVGGAFRTLIHVLHEYNLVLPSRLSMLIKCLILLEGTAQGLDATFNLAELLEPYRRQFMLQQLSPDTWLRKAKHLHRDWASLAQSLPRGFANLLEQLQGGNLAVRIRQPPLETSINRLVHALCASALLLASAMLWIHEIPPTIHGVSILGAAGYLVAALIAGRVLWLTRRSDRCRDD